MKTVSTLAVYILLQSSSSIATNIRKQLQNRLIKHF